MTHNTSRASHNALHIPVMVDRCVELFSPAFADKKAPVLIDCTLGMGGHSEAFLQAFPTLRIIGIDRDPQALELARVRLEPFGQRFQPVKATYDEIGTVAKQILGKEANCLDGVFMDLGVSSLQLDEQDRGFSYAHDAPLDMRMDQSQKMSASELVNNASEEELTTILRTYGQEKFAKKIARTIVAERKQHPFTSTGQLVELIYQCIPAPARRSGGHPAKRTFQALRIAVNSELDSLRHALPRAIDALKVGGRIVVESYQSMEDTLVKKEFTNRASSKLPTGLVMDVPGFEPDFRLVTRGAEKASTSEIAENPRSASVRLRAGEKCSADSSPARVAASIPFRHERKTS